MTSLEKPSESTPAAAGSSRNLREPASTEGDTPEARLLARKGSTAYLEDVRSLVTRAERAEASLEDAMTLLEENRTRFEEIDAVIRELGAEVERLRRGSAPTKVGSVEARARVFGTIGTIRHDED